MDFNTYIKENSLIIPEKIKGKTTTLNFWNVEKINDFYKTIVNNKVKCILPLSTTDNKKGLFEMLINDENKNNFIKYPAYDLKVLIEKRAKEQNLINFVVKSKNNKLGKNSFLKLDFSKVTIKK
jgi:hypothetical protein